MSESADQWVSQADAVQLLVSVGDRISQQALSEYLKKHPEVAKRQDGRRIWVHWPSLKASRATRAARGPSSQAPLLDLVREPTVEAPAETPKAKIIDPLGARRAEADTARSEAEARRARVLADEAEGRVIKRETAINAVTTAGIALVRAMDEARMVAVDGVRAADDVREAVLAMKKYENTLRAAFANSLSEFAVASEPELAAAE
jgi:hypothetical protein